ncbi:MAG: hypothetical protein K6U80_00105 [Firmicutes bacterium]|nr:hypothetical protein [Bacillota bacterium]
MKIRISKLLGAGLIGAGLLLGNCLISVYLVPSRAKTAPDLAGKFQKPADWGEYSNFNRALGEIIRVWNKRNYRKIVVSDEVFAAAPEALKEQSSRLRAIFDEEVRFRREFLANNLNDFQARLGREMNQKLEEETANLNTLAAGKILEKERELKTRFEKYRFKLRAEYQKRLINLSLQVLTGNNQANSFGKNEGVSKAQAEINRIREEFTAKLIDSQQQIANELTEYSKQLHETNKIAINRMRVRLSELNSRAAADFQAAQEKSYQEWYQKRSEEIFRAIELREKERVFY